MNDIDLTFVDDVVERQGKGPEKVLEILQELQDQYGWLPKEALERVCEITEITPSAITGVSTFYNRFRHKPAGEYIVRVCVGTACHVKGSAAVYDAFIKHLDIPDGEDTDADGLFTIEKVACLGCCTLAPAVQIGEVTYGHLTTETVGDVLGDYLKYIETKSSKKARRKPDFARESIDENGEIRIGLGSCCIARGSGRLHEAIEKTLRETGIHAKVKRVGCVGMCYQTPLLEVVLSDERSYLYTRVEPEDAMPIITKHFKVPGVGHRIANFASRTLDNMLTGPKDTKISRYPANIRDGHIADFLNKQKNIATEHCGNIDPVDMDEYLGSGGFDALKQAISSRPEDVIEQIRISGLRGRGGAGYHSYLKWQRVLDTDSAKKYLLCNGDEGDPGAFMDRMLMESYPLRIIEGVIIAALTVAADEGLFYIRAEYPLALKRMTEAIEKCRQYGFLGDNILSSGKSFGLRIVPGAGAFVCGEETALIASVEGRRGMPRLRPPYPAVSGLWQKPTLVSNVETYSLVPWILRNGPDAFAELGTEKSKGTKVFALAGKIAHGGLIEVPMGIKIKEIIEDIGGGVRTGKKFKAVQIGGPSGGCVPAKLSYTSVDYESLTSVGAIMGSGGLVVLDESDCMVEIARYFLEFTQNESCGKCTFCRIGTRRMLDILERLCQGQGKKGDIEELEGLARMVKKGSLCGLGKTAPNPVISTIHHFRDEYEAHINKHCPAGKCKPLITYSITDDCNGCTICAQHCPVEAIEMKPYELHTIDTEKCIRCGGCKKVCPVDAVKVE